MIVTFYTNLWTEKEPVKTDSVMTVRWRDKYTVAKEMLLNGPRTQISASASWWIIHVWYLLNILEICFYHQRGGGTDDDVICSYLIVADLSLICRIFYCISFTLFCRIQICATFSALRMESRNSQSLKASHLPLQFHCWVSECLILSPRNGVLV